MENTKVHGGPTRIDDLDSSIIDRRFHEYEKLNGALPRVGEYVQMLDGSLQRVSHVWSWGDPKLDGAQTSHGGSWYLGDGYASFSGSLNPRVPFDCLRLTAGRRGAGFWIFHHNHWQAHNGLDFSLPVRIWEQVSP